MAGKPGMKGGGGARPGAGRKPKPKAPPAPLVEIKGDDTLKLLQDIAFGRVPASTLQVRAAIAAVQYTHTKRGDGGKKDEQGEAAKKAAVGRFAPAQAPRLVAAGGKKV